jgi:hypothetical protein
VAPFIQAEGIDAGNKISPEMRIYGLFIERGIGSVLAEGTFKPKLPA